MKFYSPDHTDLIDPTFDFLSDSGNISQSDQRKRLYAHEVFQEAPYQGILIAKNQVIGGKKSYYTNSQLVRLFNTGAHRYLRIDANHSLAGLKIMGDCGAFNRTFDDQLDQHPIDEVMETISFYDACEVDFGITPDNVIPGFIKTGTKTKPSPTWQIRLNRTLSLANHFYKYHSNKKRNWIPLGVAQGWNVETYRESVEALQNMGYNYIAIGGMAFLQSAELISCVEEIYKVRLPSTHFHLLGASRLEYLYRLSQLGVSSFDSSTPIKQAVKDDQHNYHTPHKGYVAFRIPKTANSLKAQKLIKQDKIDINEITYIEYQSLKVLREFDSGNVSINEVMDILRYGSKIRKEADYSLQYYKTLTDSPWKECPCQMCKTCGIEIAMLRGKERNIRRGFHNMFVLSRKLQTIFPRH